MTTGFCTKGVGLFSALATEGCHATAFYTFCRVADIIGVNADRHRTDLGLLPAGQRSVRVYVGASTSRLLRPQWCRVHPDVAAMLDATAGPFQEFDEDRACVGRRKRTVQCRTRGAVGTLRHLAAIPDAAKEGQ
jgi:hypothetical protein